MFIRKFLPDTIEGQGFLFFKTSLSDTGTGVRRPDAAAVHGGGGGGGAGGGDRPQDAPPRRPVRHRLQAVGGCSKLHDYPHQYHAPCPSSI